MMEYAKITLSVGATYTQPLDSLDVLVEEIQNGMVGEVWTVEIVQMTEEEYAELPDFDGH